MKLLLQSMTEALESQVKSKVTIKVLSATLDLMLLLFLQDKWISK